MSYRLFAVTSPGLESVLRQELAWLKIPLQPASKTLMEGEEKNGDESGGVEFEAGTADLYRANLHLRTANRILMRFGEFYTSTFSELRSRAAKLPWEMYIRAGQSISIRVTCHKSKLYHSDAVSERVAGAIQDRLGGEIHLVKFDDDLRPVPQLVVVRIVNDQCAISLDTSGELLNRRGYRLAAAKAPLRETLAAGLLLSAGWNRSTPLLDPFCGSGTIAIEAALLAGRIASGKHRRFGFMGWSSYESKLWQSVHGEARAAELPAQGLIQASDRDAGAVKMAQENAVRAGVMERIEFTCCAVSAVEPPPGPGCLVTNPPYGVRVSPSHDLRNLYAQLGNVLRAKMPGWQTGILCSDRMLAGQVGLAFGEPLHMVNGGLAVGFYRAKVPAGE